MYHFSIIHFLQLPNIPLKAMMIYSITVLIVQLCQRQQHDLMART